MILSSSLIFPMPIEVSTAIQVFDQEEFHTLDRRIMGVVFDVHNEFGRLLDEDLYKCEIASRCVAIGLQPAQREVRIRVSHQSFIKDYFMVYARRSKRQNRGRTESSY